MSKFGNIDDYVTDPGLELSGIDLSFGKGRFITVKRSGGANEQFTNHVANKLREQDATVVNRSAMDEEVATEIMYDAYARFVVIGWRGWKDDKGKDIPFSAENCIELFNDSREIYEHVVTQCNKADNFRTLEVKQSGKE